MGPLVPSILSEQFDVIVALLVGIGFGFVLEQAGFSSTKKLVGLFYGYDFTVLRVFFTAGVTAMIGVVLLAHYGLLDLSMVYVNPMFLRSAVVGGLIMGAGFIVGGFCPGTSVCAAAVGKMDAMAFIVGSFLGVFIFAEGYPLFRDFYFADAMGPVRINEFFGMSQSLFAFVLTAVALAAFYFTWKIEVKVNGRKGVLSKPLVARYALAMLVPFVAIAVVAFLPDKTEIINNRVANEMQQKKCAFNEIDADKLAYEIANHYYQFNVIDVRSPDEFDAFHLPLAINIPYKDLMNKKYEQYFNQKAKTNVFYSNSDSLTQVAYLKVKYIGYSNNLILRQSADTFRKMFYDIQPPVANAPKQAVNEYLFRSKAAADMERLSDALKNMGKEVKTEVKVAKGGCS